MEVIKRKLTENRGDLSFTAIAIILFSIGFILVIMTFMAAMINFQKIDDDIQSATLAVAANNTHNIFAGVREGNSAERNKTSSDWQKTINLAPADVAVEFARTYARTAVGTTIEIPTKFKVTIDAVSVDDVDVKDNIGRCKIYTTATITIPITLFRINIPITRTEQVASEFSSYF